LLVVRDLKSVNKQLKLDFFFCHFFFNEFFRYLPNRGQKNAPRRNH
jgi:hypothetical protein